MAYLVVLVLDDPDQCSPILDAWEAAGAKGITIIESSGLGRVRKAGIRDDLPLMPSLRDLLQSREKSNRTLFSVVENEEHALALAEAAKSIIGDLNRPNTGLLFIASLLHVFGLQKNWSNG